MIIEKVYNSCEICKRYSKTPPKPVVAMPLDRSFNEAVAMDLKEWKNGLKILYLIDMFTQYTLAQWVPSQYPEVIIDKVMLMWIGSGLGAFEKFLADNGGSLPTRNIKTCVQI